jgi:hypothetical protein
MQQGFWGYLFQCTLLCPPSDESGNFGLCMHIDIYICTYHIRECPLPAFRSSLMITIPIK